MSYGLEVRNSHDHLIFSTDFYAWHTHTTITVPRQTSGSTDFPELAGYTVHALSFSKGILAICLGGHRTRVNGTRVYWDWVYTFGNDAPAEQCTDSYIQVYYR